jgi:hypothetical protein
LLIYWLLIFFVKLSLRLSGGSSSRRGLKSAPQESQRETEKLPNSSETTQRCGRLAFGFFLTGTLGTLLLMTVSYRHDMALIFGGTALLLAFIFGVMSWRERLGKFVVIALGSVLGVGGLLLLVYLGAFGPARRAAVERVMRDAELANLERTKSAVAEKLRPHIKMRIGVTDGR